VSAPVLEITNLTTNGLATWTVLKGIDLTMHKGDGLSSLIGSSGSGKTTSAALRQSAEQYEEGVVSISGEQIGYTMKTASACCCRKQKSQTAKGHDRMAFQHFNLFLI